jgi:hypothetical protein
MSSAERPECLRDRSPGPLPFAQAGPSPCGDGTGTPGFIRTAIFVTPTRPSEDYHDYTGVRWYCERDPSGGEAGGRERKGETAASTCGPAGRADHGVIETGCRVDPVAPQDGVLEPSPADQPVWLRDR